MNVSNKYNFIPEEFHINPAQVEERPELTSKTKEILNGLGAQCNWNYREFPDKQKLNQRVELIQNAIENAKKEDKITPVLRTIFIVSVFVIAILFGIFVIPQSPNNIRLAVILFVESFMMAGLFGGVTEVFSYDTIMKQEVKDFAPEGYTGNNPNDTLSAGLLVGLSGGILAPIYSAMTKPKRLEKLLELNQNEYQSAKEKITTQNRQSFREEHRFYMEQAARTVDQCTEKLNQITMQAQNMAQEMGPITPDQIQNHRVTLKQLIPLQESAHELVETIDQLNKGIAYHRQFEQPLPEAPATPPPNPIIDDLKPEAPAEPVIPLPLSSILNITVTKE